MPTKDPIAAARREAKARARKGGITHQQALDAVAHESGHANWSAMTGSSAATAKPVATTVATETIARPEAMDETRRAAIRSMTRLNDWIGSAMREAPTRAIEGYVSRDRMHHAIREVPLNAQTIAQAVDPDHGPWPDAKRLTVRCPLHEDRNGSLVISGKGRDIGMRCMAGCDDAAVQEHALARLSDAAVRAAAFMKANDARKVFEGFGRGTEGVGGMGGVYRLTDGSRHELDTLTCRMLAEGYPVWIHGKVPPSLYSVETALRVALAGRYPITVEQPADMRQGTWQATISVFKGYDVIVQWRKGGPYGVSTTFEHEFKGTSDERHPSIRAVVARALKLVESHETTDPERLAEEKARVAREMAHRAANTGVDAEGWGWWAGPNEDEFTWGGPYTSKEYAKGEANGHCGERGEAFFVVFAKADMSMEPVDGELVPFVDSRKPILCRSR
jgi:hypothetical protein